MSGFFDEGYRGVSFFFLLSGFILSHVYSQTYSIEKHGWFVWLRFARIWPVHVAMLLMLLGYVAVGLIVRGRYVPDFQYQMSALPQELAMVRSWSSDVLIWNMPAWSIHCEWFAYIFLFPVCCYSFRRVKNSLLMALTVGVILTVHTHLNYDLFPGKLGIIFLPFFAGSGLHRLRVLWPNARGALIADAGAAAFMLGCIAGDDRAFAVAFSLLILGLSYEEGWIARFFSTRWMVFGGIISYSLYMSQIVPLKFANELLKRWHPDGALQNSLVLAGLLVAMLALATALQRWVEAPANRWLRNVVRPQPKAPLPEPNQESIRRPI